MATIELRGITVAYGDKPVLDNLDLFVQDGEFLVLVGPSGCGKTTALRVVAGLLMPTGGQVLIDGQDVERVAPAERDLAMVFQSYALYPHMTVRQNMAFALRLAHVSKQEVQARVTSAAEILGLTALLDRRPKSLSGGQRQRVAMGRAIVRHPRAFLMDEPLSNLDAKLRVRMRAEIARLQRSLGTTTLYVTHDQVEAMTMADRIAVLHDGKLQQLGTPEELFDTPANVFVAAFIGNPPINLVAGRLESGDGGRTVLCVGNQTVPLPRSIDSPATIRAANKREVLVGIRPHDVQTEPAPGQLTALRVNVDLDLVERLGTETIAHGDLAGVTSGPAIGSAALAAVLVRADQELGADAQGTRFAAALGSHVTVTPGTQLPLYVPVERLHLFDAETGVAIQVHERRAADQVAPSEAHTG
jgi:multiple sugar transport system ATP-binding protein